jgi:hypothetical protein
MGTTNKTFSVTDRAVTREQHPTDRNIAYTRAAEPMARLTKVAHEIFFASGIHCCPNFFPDQPCYIMKNMKAQRLFDYHYYKMKLRVNNLFVQTKSGEKLLVG